MPYLSSNPLSINWRSILRREFFWESFQDLLHNDDLKRKFGYTILSMFLIELLANLPTGEWLSQHNYYIHVQDY